MNYRGSYRKLLENAKAAIIAAIEIYNKPSFQYRDECSVILLLNAWELLLKALLSKNKASIFYHKKRHEPYRTLSWQDALGRAERFFPSDMHPLPVRRNLELLGTYRDNSVHFYNADGFGVLIYALAQTNVTNFRDLLNSAFGVRLEREISWQLLPLGIKPPIDPIAYIGKSSAASSSKGNAVQQYLAELSAAVSEVQGANQDTGRLMTVFQVKLESTKKITKADVVVGVEKAEGATGPLAIVKTVDPNKSHPLRQKDVIEKIGTLDDAPFTPYTFTAIAWKHNLKSKSTYCWRASEGFLTRYSEDVILWLKRLTQADIEAALKDYRSHLQEKRKQKKSKVASS